ncbi:nucleotidyltransferase family protein [Clostridium botulinum]|uniref:nucleotidyltransferase family protein n=1 Tax=Clostridium botulinum TaxID=1491 RepID=UPI0007735E39|nr:nucleotidyltransferase family protein [Clostridium botulinum]
MINNIDKILVYSNYSIKDSLQILDKGAKGIVIVVDKDKKLIGTVTDGDIRRAILKGISLNECIVNIMNKSPISIKQETSREKAKEIIIKNGIKDLPIVDENNNIVDMITINDIILPEGKENPVVIMAGGLGTRLKELTKEIPKPMLKVGNDPILYHIINNFKQYGYNKFFVSVNYKAGIIENYFQDGYAYGVKIEYIKENKRLGTAGGIKLAENLLYKPFFVINGDVFTNLNVNNMMDFHIENNFDITLGIRKQYFKIPYGVVKTKGSIIEKIEEKPELEYLINAGVYCLNPELIKFIPKDRYFEITDLINIGIKKGLKVGSYEIKDYWMDIGRIEDYNKVNEDVYNLFK